MVSWFGMKKSTSALTNTRGGRLRWPMRFFFKPIVLHIRGILLVIVAALLLWSIFAKGQTPTPEEVHDKLLYEQIMAEKEAANGLAIEHRFTALETKVVELKELVDELKSYDWLKVIALSGLVGEAGIRNLARKGQRRREEDQEES